MLTLKKVSKSYYIGKESIAILKDINLTINRGEFVSIVGPSGCGKTTLLNLLSGMDRVSAGTIEFQGERIDTNKDKQWSDWRKCKVGYIFQNFNLIEFMTARQNVELVLQANGVDKKERRKIASELLERVGLGERQKHLPSQLSGGQKQRVAIARALANNPSILLADEPTGAMDSGVSKEIMDLLKKINKDSNVTIVMVTHDEKLAEQVDRKITMLDGKIVSDKYLVEKKCEQLKIESTKCEKKGGRFFAFSDLAIALRNMMTKKKRTFLTSLGTSIGIAGVLLVCGIGIGTKERIMEELNTVVNMQIVDLNEADAKVTEDMKTELLTDKRILDIYPNNRPEVYCQFGDMVGSGIVHSIGPLENSQKYWEDRLLYGTVPSGDDKLEAIITLTMAEKLVGEEHVQNIIGKEIDMAFMATSQKQLSKISIRKVKVVGISGKAFLGVADIVNIPFMLAEEVVRESLQDENYHSTAYCVTVVDETKAVEVKDLLNTMGFKASIDIEALGSIGVIVDLVTAVIMLLAGISLVVSGIMIALVTYMGVTERIREIGILRAIGFSAKNIKRIFLIEGVTVGFFAGTIGVIFASLLGRLVNEVVAIFFTEVAFKLYKVGIGQILFCVFFSMLIGLICAYSPARRASKMEPVKALGYVQ